MLMLGCGKIVKILSSNPSGFLGFKFYPACSGQWMLAFSLHVGHFFVIAHIRSLEMLVAFGQVLRVTSYPPCTLTLMGSCKKDIRDDRP